MGRFSFTQLKSVMAEEHVYLIVKNADGKLLSLWLKRQNIKTKVLPVFSSEEKAQTFIDEANFGLDNPPLRHIRQYSSAQFDSILGSMISRGISHFWRDVEYRKPKGGDGSELVHIAKYLRGINPSQNVD